MKEILIQILLAFNTAIGGVIVGAMGNLVFHVLMKRNGK